MKKQGSDKRNTKKRGKKSIEKEEVTGVDSTSKVLISANHDNRPQAVGLPQLQPKESLLAPDANSGVISQPQGPGMVGKFLGGVVLLGSFKDVQQEAINRRRVEAGLDKVDTQPASVKRDEIPTMFSRRLEPDEQKPFKSLRRLAVGNMASHAKPELFQEYFTRVFLKAGGPIEKTGNPVLEVVKTSSAPGVFYVEMRSIEEAMACLSMEGLNYGGKNITIKRDLTSPHLATVGGTRSIPTLNESVLGPLRATTQVQDAPDKLRISNLPLTSYEDEIIPALCRFGEVKEFYLVRELVHFKSKGIAWCRFADPVATSHALASPISLDKKILSVTLWNEGSSTAQPPKPLNSSVSLIANGGPKKTQIVRQKTPSRSSSKSSSSSRSSSGGRPGKMNLEALSTPQTIIVGTKAVDINLREECSCISLVSSTVCLEGFLDARELETNMYFDLSAEVERQLGKFGQVKSLKILRKTEGFAHPGRVLVDYARLEAGVLAKFTLDGVKFGGRAVRTSFFNSKQFENGIYE